MKTSLKKSNPNKKVMSDTNECCVCYEATEHLTPCNHLVCESCYPRLNTCPMCRAPLGRLVEEDSDFDIIEVSFELNLRMAEAAEAGHEDIVRLMLSQGANAYNTGLTSAAAGGHESIVKKKAIINLKNTDNKCFMWAVTRALSQVALNDPLPQNSLKKIFLRHKKNLKTSLKKSNPNKKSNV